MDLQSISCTVNKKLEGSFVLFKIVENFTNMFCCFNCFAKETENTIYSTTVGVTRALIGGGGGGGCIFIYSYSA